MKPVLVALIAAIVSLQILSVRPVLAEERVGYTVGQFRFSGTFTQVKIWKGGAIKFHSNLSFASVNSGSGQSIGSGQTWDGKATVNVTGTIAADFGPVCRGTSTFTTQIQIKWGTQGGESRPLTWSFVDPSALPSVCSIMGVPAYTSEDYLLPLTQSGQPWPVIPLAGSNPNPDAVAKGKSIAVHYEGHSEWSPPPQPAGECGPGCFQEASTLPTQRTYDLSALLIPGEQCRYTVSFVNGRAQVVHAGGVADLHLNSAVVEGDSVRTTANGRVMLHGPGGIEIKFAPGSEVKIGRIACEGQSQKTNVKLSFGRIWTKITSLISGDDHFEVESSNSAIGSRGTIFVSAYDAKERTTAVRTIEHAVFLKSGGTTLMVPQGSCGRVRDTSRPELVSCATVARLVETP